MLENKKPNAWREAVIRQLVVHGILAQKHESDPYAARSTLLDWVSDIALDHAVSREARDLIAKAKAEEREACAGIAQDEMDSQFCDVDAWYACRAIRDAIRARGEEDEQDD
jgi:hypothetical protein